MLWSRLYGRPSISKKASVCRPASTQGYLLHALPQRPYPFHVPKLQACPVSTYLLTGKPAHRQTCHVRSAWPTWGLRGLLRGMTPLRALPSCPGAVCTKLWGTWGPPLASSACRTYCTSSSFGPILSAPMPACIIRLRHCCSLMLRLQGLQNQASEAVRRWRAAQGCMREACSRLAWQGDGPSLQTHERVGGPQDGQPLLIVAELLWPLRFRKLQHLQPKSP